MENRQEGVSGVTSGHEYGTEFAELGVAAKGQSQTSPIYPSLWDYTHLHTNRLVFTL